MRLRLDYPSQAEERLILQRFRENQPLQEVKPVLSAETLKILQGHIRHVRVDASVEAYIVELVRATREHNSIELGVSPRGTLALYRASQAFAAIYGRSYVIPDDVKQLARPVLTHRMLANSLHGRVMDQVIDDILQNVAVPVEP